MKYKTAADLRQAINARMRSLAKEKSMPIERLHRHIAFERLLARLLKKGQSPLDTEGWLCHGVTF